VFCFNVHSATGAQCQQKHVASYSEVRL